MVPLAQSRGTNRPFFDQFPIYKGQIVIDNNQQYFVISLRHLTLYRLLHRSNAPLTV